ncbi:MAG: YSC84-related protein [Paraburkholderia sp.]|uniref:BPSL1445 family SYLF domain-containing lipoprotein n=1 Tax=Paraburkholderia sp. TaxID=1926495 RepID=UPI003C439870
MKVRRFILNSSMIVALTGVMVAGCTTTSNAPPSAATNDSRRQSIDASVDGALSRLYQTVPGSHELVGKARGVLVFPSVVQAGVAIGGEHGDGALRVDGSTAGYYSTTSLSVGATLGIQSKAVIYVFMTQEALDKFRNADGWSAGGDASVALVKLGANGSVDTTTATKPVEVFIVTNSGLMGDLSLGGAKITRLSI